MMRFCLSCPDCGLGVPYNASVCPFCGSRRISIHRKNSSQSSIY